MTAAADERHVWQERERLALPKFDRWIWPHDPVAIGSVKMDRHVAEGPAPFHHARIEMRVRDADRGEPAETPDQRHGRGVQHCDRVPQHVAVRRAHEECSLSNGEMRLGADTY